MASYKCDIARVSVSGETGGVSLQLQDIETQTHKSQFGWRWFSYVGPNSNMVLATALAALTADLAVGVDLDSTQEYSPIKEGIHAAKRFTIEW